MSNDDELLRDNMNPLTEAILEAADDLERGRPLGPAAADPLAAAAPLTTPLEDLAPAQVAVEEPVEVEESEPAEKKKGFFARLAEASPYTVLLAVSLTVMLVAITLLALELHAYNWDVKAAGPLT